MTQNTLDFDGATFSRQQDGLRLNRQMQAVYDVMRDGQWRTLEQISHATGAPPASVSARLRDFRKAKFGGLQVDRNRVSGGLWEYRIREGNNGR